LIAASRLLGLLALALLPAVALAQAFPAKPIRIVVGFAPGGPTDIVTRAIAQKLAENLGQSVVVDNRAGAGGVIATAHVAKAAADGYTLLMGTIGGLVVAMSLQPDRGYDTLRDFAPITQTVVVTNIMVVPASAKASSVQELLAMARANPGKLNYASSGNGTAPHLAGELLKSMAGVSIQHVPYKGGAPALAALLAGEVDLSYENSLVVLPHVKAGRVKALAVTGARRSRLLPDLPTIAESGLPGYEASGWYGLMAPIATPREIVERLNVEAIKVLRAPDVVERLSGQGAEPVGNSSAQFGAFLRAEIEKWGKLARAIGLKAE
jgi:tripartite-type tricarboxylate transporter receptor subunit TctC